MSVKGEGLTHRQRQALATKEQIAGAARSLFAEHGYVTTTFAAIATAADIPAPTIYSAFGTKATILKEIAWKSAAALDVDRTHDEAIADPDPARGLSMAAALQRRQYEAMYDVIAIYQEAARTDDAIAADLAHILANRERAFRRHLEAIADQLTTDVDEALAIYLTLVLPEVYRTLVLERGWTPDRYETWLARNLTSQLLHPPVG
jgi:AcrR family transcriptional regulator